MYRFDIDKLQQSRDCISGYDASLNIAVWNPVLEKKFNIPAKDAIGKYVLDLFPQVKDDHRIQCLRDAITEKRVFYFSSLPYVFEKGIYTQLIFPVTHRSDISVISIVRDHISNERYLKNDLLQPILR